MRENIQDGRLNDFYHLQMHKVTGPSKVFNFLPKYHFSAQFIKPLLLAVGTFFLTLVQQKWNNSWTILGPSELGLALELTS